LARPPLDFGLLKPPLALRSSTICQDLIGSLLLLNAAIYLALFLSVLTKVLLSIPSVKAADNLLERGISALIVPPWSFFWDLLRRVIFLGTGGD